MVLKTKHFFFFNSLIILTDIFISKFKFLQLYCLLDKLLEIILIYQKKDYIENNFFKKSYSNKLKKALSLFFFFFFFFFHFKVNKLFISLYIYI